MFPVSYQLIAQSIVKLDPPLTNNSSCLLRGFCPMGGSYPLTITNLKLNSFIPKGDVTRKNCGLLFDVKDGLRWFWDYFYAFYAFIRGADIHFRGCLNPEPPPLKRPWSEDVKFQSPMQHFNIIRCYCVLLKAIYKFKSTGSWSNATFSVMNSTAPISYLNSLSPCIILHVILL